VYMTEDSLSFANLVDPDNLGADRKIKILVGGQEGEYREEQLVSRALVLCAARQYFENGHRASSLMWIEG
ncbi:MAG: hypothetical protein ORO03_06320, partial [Alphaproteobacteria bacterium]|nr:hypothetical protein [Alphaproteobacteria bacterium]